MMRAETFGNTRKSADFPMWSQNVPLLVLLEPANKFDKLAKYFDELANKFK
jgi:hypothetical protein